MRYSISVKSPQTFTYQWVIGPKPKEGTKLPLLWNVLKSKRQYESIFARYLPCCHFEPLPSNNHHFCFNPSFVVAREIIATSRGEKKSLFVFSPLKFPFLNSCWKNIKQNIHKGFFYIFFRLFTCQFLKLKKKKFASSIIPISFY